MSSSSRELRKLVTTKSHMRNAEAPEAVRGLNKIITAVNSSAGAAAGGSVAAGSAGGKLQSSSAATAAAVAAANHNVTLSTAVIPGAPDPVKLLSLSAENVRNTTELHMGRKAMKTIHPNFQHFVNLEILWLNQNDLTSVHGLIPATGAREALMAEAEKNTTKKRGGLSSSTAMNGTRNGAGTSTAAPSGLDAAVKQMPMSSTLLLMQNTAAVGNTAANNRNNNTSMMAMSRKEKESNRRSIMLASMGDGSDDDAHSDDEYDDDGNLLFRRRRNANGLIPGALNTVLAVPPRGCRRLKHLYLSDNRINTVDGDLQHLKYLETLLLSNNLLTDMHGVSRKLQHLLCLKQLDLFGNPLCEQQGYRLYMIAHHPTVEILDRERVTEAERQQAKALYGNKRANYESLMNKSGALSAALKKNGGQFNMSSLVDKDSVASSSVNNGGNNGGDSDGDESRNMTLKEKSLMRSTVGFGTAVPPAKPMLRAEPISASVAILESRASMIQAEQAATRRRAKDKEAAELSELAEQRRLFHSAWEGAADNQAQAEQEAAAKAANDLLLQQQMLLDASVTTGKRGNKGGGGAGGANASMLAGGANNSGLNTAASSPSAKGGSKNAQAQQQAQQRTEQLQQQAMAEYQRLQAMLTHQQSLGKKERLVSSIYHLDTDKASDPKIAEIIELQRRREEAENIGDEDQVLSLDEELRRLQHHLLPERRGDVFKTAMDAQDASTIEEDARRYNTHIVEKVLLYPTELAMVKKQFNERGSVFSLDRLRHLLMASVSIASGSTAASSSDGAKGGKAPSSALSHNSSVASINTSMANGGSGSSIIATIVTPSLVDTVRNAFVNKYPAGPELDALSLPMIRNNRAMSVVAQKFTLPTANSASTAAASATVSPNAAGGARGRGAKAASTQNTPQTSALNPTGSAANNSTSNGNAVNNSTSGALGASTRSATTSFSVDTALFMAMRDATSADAGLMTPIAVYDALIALSRIPAFVAAKKALLEQLALKAMQSHSYDKLKEYQQRINDLSAHLAALKANSAPISAIHGASVRAAISQQQAAQQQQRRYSTVSNFSTTSAFAASNALHSSANPNAEAAMANEGYVELKNVKALWGSVQVRAKERAIGEAAFASATNSAPGSAPDGQSLAATLAAAAASGMSPIPPAGRRR